MQQERHSHPALTNHHQPQPGRSLRIPTWGFGGPALDLAVAYEKAAARVLSVRPTLLVFAQGLTGGRDLRLVRLRPLVLRDAWPGGRVVANQLSYEVHEYPFLYGGFNFSDYAAYRARLDAAWGYIAATDRAPVWLGEFGVAHTREGLDSPWWRAVTR